MKRQLFGVFLALCMAIAFLFVPTLAAETESDAEARETPMELTTTEAETSEELTAESSDVAQDLEITEAESAILASDIVASGECGDKGGNVTWTLDSEGTLTISGAGKMKTYNSNYPPWYKNPNIKNVSIQYGVTSISYAFEGCSGLTSVSIPNSVTSIGNNAFFGCSSLTNVTIPDSVTFIGIGAFGCCDSLRNIYVSDANQAYTSRNGVLFDKAKTIILAFPAGKTDSYYAIPDGVISIEGSAFFGCKNLKDVVIPNSVTHIEDNAFQGCYSLTTLTIPNSVTSIEALAFSDCSGLTSVTIPDSVISIAHGAFEYCSGLTSVTIPNGVVSLGDWAFEGCSGLKNVDISNCLSFIGDNTFRCCGLTSVSIPNGVPYISRSMFYDCSSLTSVTIPTSVTKIGEYAFYGCYNLKDVYYAGSEAQWNAITLRSVGNGHLKGAAIHYNSGGEGSNEVGNEVKATQITYTSGVGKTEYPLTVQWGWDLFKDSAYVPDTRKAIVAAALSRAAEAGQDKVEAMLQTLGFTFYYSDNYKFDWTDVEHPAFTMGHKLIELNGKETDFYILVIRGTKGFDDALTDAGSWFGAFGSAAAYIRSELDAFFDTSHITTKKDAVFFITGHSLGGATANVLAANLSEDFSDNRIFAYTFAAPAPMFKSDKNSYKNIFNLVNREDGVARIATWRLNRNGFTAWFDRKKVSFRIYDNFKDITSGKDLEYLMKWHWNFHWGIHVNLTAHSMDTYLAFLLTDSNALEKQLEEAGLKITSVQIRPFGSKLAGSDALVSLTDADFLNVEVYVSDNIVGRVVNGEIDASVEQSVYIEADDDGISIYMFDDDDFAVKMTGSGQAEYVAESFDLSTSEVTESKVFSNIQLSHETSLSSIVGSSIQPEEVQLLTVDESGAFTGKIETDGSETEITTATPTISANNLRYENNKVSVTAVIDNFTADSVKGNLFAAIYEDGQLLDVACLADIETPSGREIRRELEFNSAVAPRNESNLTAKLFYVDTATMQSLTPAAEIRHGNKE